MLRPLPTILMLSMLTACSAEQDTAQSPAPAAVETPAMPVPLPVEPEDTQATGQFDTGFSVRTLMNAVVDPNAKRIWEAVRYVVNQDGVQEDTVPQTDEDWAGLRESAITLIEAGNAIQLPGRMMDHEAPGPDYPAWKYLPDEIRAHVDADPEGWLYFIQEMQFSTRETLATIEKRDVLGLIDTGARINNACQGCHAQYWYRPNNPQR